LINVGELMTDLDFVEAFTMRRGTKALANEGEVTVTWSAPANLVGSIQPAEAKEIKQLPEGQRGSGDGIVIFTATELMPDDGNNTVSDVVTWDGKNYKVVGIEDWSANGYYRALAVEIAA
jgi:hypothetical protein